MKNAQIDLDKTFPIWTKYAESLIKNPEDVKFLESMKTDRAAFFASHDTILALQLRQ
jgi:hypothetical protein